MFTRQDYLNKVCTHSEYYSQFVNEQTKAIVLTQWSREQLAESFAKDSSFNNLPLYKWDGLARFVKVSLKPYGDYLTLSGQVCILKESARHIVKEM